MLRAVVSVYMVRYLLSSTMYYRTQDVVCASREATDWPECYLWYHSCAHGVVETQKAKRIISAVQHYCLAVQNKELVLNIASYNNNSRGNA